MMIYLKIYQIINNNYHFLLLTQSTILTSLNLTQNTLKLIGLFWEKGFECHISTIYR